VIDFLYFELRFADRKIFTLVSSYLAILLLLKVSEISGIDSVYSIIGKRRSVCFFKGLGDSTEEL
jgi:hypothetical protein